MSLSEIAMSRETLKLITVEYTIRSEGSFLDEPIIELFARDSNGERRMIQVEGFYPYFYISEREFIEKKGDILNESMVRWVEVREDILAEETKLNGSVEPVSEAPRTTLNGEKLVKLVLVTPSQARKLRKFFSKHYEADVFFTNRFLIDTGIYRGFTVPSGETHIHVDDIEPVDEEKTPDVQPRIHTVDIEVWSGGEFPDVDTASKPITAISAHDSYTDQYFIGALHPDTVPQGEGHTWGDEIEWELPSGVDASQGKVQVYHNENKLLADYFKFVNMTDPDIMTGWNSSRNEMGSGFDYPYILNRADAINEWTFNDLTYDGGRVFVSKRGQPVIGGRQMFDMLQAYKKTQIHEKRSYALGAIAQEELGYGKEDIENLDTGWTHNPVDFMRYNIRDVQAVVGIEKEQDVLDLYDNLRYVAGCTYDEAADSNIGIIDVLFLRKARERGVALPTSTKPNRNWYYGAKVFNPSPGKHKNVVYPDLASLYPYLMWSLNVSPETIYDTVEEAEEDGFSEDDLYTAYIDRRNDSEKRSSSPETTEVYYVNPNVKSGFVRDVVDELVDMKYEYKGQGKAYEAVKRITNSIYGVFGDSNSWGRGFRLFDWRLAESITISGQMVLEHTAETFTDTLHSMGYHDAELIGGDTDSVMTKIPTAKDMDEAIEASFTAADAVNESYDTFMSEMFGIHNSEDHKMEVEVESFAESIFFLRDMDSDNPNDGIKKKYSQLVTWDDGEYIENPEPKTKGFKLVRSDTASITGEVQTHVLHTILREDEPKELVREYVKHIWDLALGGDMSLEEIGIPSGITSDPMDYGWSLDEKTNECKFYTPQPHIRGSRYATAYIEGEEIEAGSKPLMFYVNNVQPGGDYPETYQYNDIFSLNAPKDCTNLNAREMKEIDRPVDAIAVEDIRHIPQEINIDYEKMAEKTVRDALENIVETMGWSFDDLVTEGAQAGLAQFM